MYFHKNVFERVEDRDCVNFAVVNCRVTANSSGTASHSVFCFISLCRILDSHQIDICVEHTKQSGH